MYQDPDGRKTEFFGFVSLTGEFVTPVVHPGAEAIYIGGFSSDCSGWGGYSATIEALGGHVGGHENGVGTYVGVEQSTCSAEAEPINLFDARAGPEIPLLGGLAGGVGTYGSPSDCGLYVYVDGGVLGEHVSVGFGASTQELLDLLVGLF